MSHDLESVAAEPVVVADKEKVARRDLQWHYYRVVTGRAIDAAA